MEMRLFCTTQQQNNQPSALKMGRETEQTFFQRRHSNGQKVHEKVLSILSKQGNANPDHDVTSHLLTSKTQMMSAGETCSKGNLCVLLVGM